MQYNRGVGLIATCLSLTFLPLFPALADQPNELKSQSATLDTTAARIADQQEPAQPQVGLQERRMLNGAVQKIDSSKPNQNSEAVLLQIQLKALSTLAP